MSFCWYKINLTGFDVVTLTWSELHTMPKCGSSVYSMLPGLTLHCTAKNKTQKLSNKYNKYIIHLFRKSFQ